MSAQLNIIGAIEVSLALNRFSSTRNAAHHMQLLLSDNVRQPSYHCSLTQTKNRPIVNIKAVMLITPISSELN